jgi:tetratricopeptide (TPR) repeat protein
MCVSPESPQFERSMDKLVELGLAISRGEASSRIFLEYAETLWNVRDLQATIDALYSAIAGSPPLSSLDLSRAYASRSICYVQLGDIAQAIADANTSIDILPRAHPYGLRAITLLHQGRQAEALADIEQAARMDPDDWEVRAWRGTIFLEIGRYAEALADINWVLETGENHRYASELYLARARTQLALGNPVEAAADCNLAIEEDYHEQSHWPFIVRSRAQAAYTAYLVRAEARLRLGELARALGDCCFAATIAPGEAAIYELRARVYQAIGNMPEAIRDLIRADHLHQPTITPDDSVPHVSESVLVGAGA